jgi:pyridoxal phosphate enzyme (YggS family)
MNKENLHKIEAEIKKDQALLIAVSKTRSEEEVMTLYDLGYRDFGENRLQEFVEKSPLLPNDINWHFIGHLQRKKVKKIIGSFHLIHSVDSFPLLEEIIKHAAKNQIQTSVLLQFKIGQEDSKYGFDIHSFENFFNPDKHQSEWVSINGVMGMATFTPDLTQIRTEFHNLNKIFNRLKLNLFQSSTFKEISMGMSGDYKIALQEGSTMIRIGTMIFGPRKYL